jgi:hypothetical protein
VPVPKGERETGRKSVFYSHGSSLFAVDRFFSMSHAGANSFSSCLFLQNLGLVEKSAAPGVTGIVAGNAPGAHSDKPRMIR